MLRTQKLENWIRDNISVKMNILIKKTTLKLLWKQFSFLNNYCTVNDMKILHAEHMRRSKCGNEWGVNEIMVMCLTLPTPYYICYLLWLLYLSFRSMDYSDIIELTKVLSEISPPWKERAVYLIRELQWMGITIMVIKVLYIISGAKKL